MRNFAQFISSFFHPLLNPLWGAFLFPFYTLLFIYPIGLQLRMVLTIAVFTLVLPLIALVVLRKVKLISDYEVFNRDERTIPYLIIILSYTFCALTLWNARFPIWVISYMMGGVLSAVINMGINKKWKISAHCTSIGGISGSIFALCYLQQLYPFYLLSGAILIPGLVASSRVYLQQHTLGQTIAGTLIGFITMFASITLFIS